MLLFTFSGTAVLLGLVGLCALVILAIVGLRFRLRTELSVPGKRPKQSAFSYTAPLHRLSLCVAIAGSLIAINWTQYDGQVAQTAYVVDADLLIEQVIPPTQHRPPPPPPPPPPPVIEAVAEPELEPETFENQDIEVDEAVEARVAPPTPPAPASAPPPPPPPPPVPEDDYGEVTLFAEQMPIFGTECFELPHADQKVCSDRALLTFVQSRLNYPALARENGIEGMVVISFVVKKDGSISEVNAVRPVGGGLTEAALKAVNAITEEAARFRPGRQGGRLVRVRFNLPVKFQLQ